MIQRIESQAKKMVVLRNGIEPLLASRLGGRQAGIPQSIGNATYKAR